MQPPSSLELIAPTVVARFLLGERLASMKKTVALPADAIYLIIQNHFRALAALGATHTKQKWQASAPALADGSAPIRRSASAEITELDTMLANACQLISHGSGETGCGRDDMADSGHCKSGVSSYFVRDAVHRSMRFSEITDQNAIALISCWNQCPSRFPRGKLFKFSYSL
jgi:hypothetical protein